MKLRVARHTEDLNKVIYFYQHLLGFENLGSFTDHQGYDGVFLGIKEQNWHLEFTTSTENPIHQPDKDDLLVFYCKTENERLELVKRLEKSGITEVSPKNPYWVKNGTTFIDPDGFRIVLSTE